MEPESNTQEVTRILNAVGSGQPGAEDLLTTCVYHELRRMAHAQMRRERVGGTLDTTALVHEAYVRLVSGGPLASDSLRYFYAAAAEAMRRILVENARRRRRLRHGGNRERVPLDTVEPVTQEPAALIDLSMALDDLDAIDPRKALIVKLRYFVGLSVAQCAEALGISERTSKEDWRIARMWLNRHMADEDTATS